LIKQVNDIGPASPGQQKALEQTTEALKKVAEKVTSTIEQLKSDQHRVQMPAFQGYVKTNYKLVSNLEAVISNYADYAYAKAKAERLERSLEIGS
jgi:hypothetical protein